MQQDLQNADCILIQGSNMAECHPVGFQWVMEAKARGATVIHVDPRFTRTSALADLHVPLRAGSDIVFLGGIINYVLANEKYFRDYVVAYTNAAVILTEDFADTEDLDGVFSGLDTAAHRYDKSTWSYQGAMLRAAAGSRGVPYDLTGRGDSAAATGTPQVAESLEHPRCVFQVLKRHFARYTPEMVEQACGVPPDVFTRVCELLTANSGRVRTTAFVYSVGWTQHTVGVQYIRTAAILQALLGNIGRPGGGMMALRGHASIQGSTDIPTLFDLLPGYLPMPAARAHPDLDSYIADIAMSKGFWANARAYTVSLLKSYWGPAATAENDFCFDYLPRLTGDHSTYPTVVEQLNGTCRGYFLLGQNPAVGSANARMQRLGLANLDWLVVRDMVDDRERDLVAGRSRDQERRAAHRGHQDRGVLPARRGAHREGGQLHQYPADAAVAPRGGAAVRRRAQRPVVHVPPGPPHPREAGLLGRRDGPPGAGPHLGLPHPRAAGRAVGRGRAGRDQRLGRRRSAAVRVRPAQGRRIDGLRMLDLQRRLRRRGQPGGAAQARIRAELDRAGVGLGLARQPADPVQPRLC